MIDNNFTHLQLHHALHHLSHSDFACHIPSPVDRAELVTNSHILLEIAEYGEDERRSDSKPLWRMSHTMVTRSPTQLIPCSSLGKYHRVSIRFMELSQQPWQDSRTSLSRASRHAISSAFFDSRSDALVQSLIMSQDQRHRSSHTRSHPACTHCIVAHNPM